MSKSLPISIFAIFVSLTSYAQNQKSSSLTEAYQREYIYLTSQKKNLLKSKKETLEHLKLDLININNQVERKNLSLNQIENLILKRKNEFESYQELVANNKTNKRKIESLSEQSKETLKNFGYIFPDHLSAEESLSLSFKNSEDFLKSIDSVQKQEKNIFDINGQKKKSQLFQFGLISTMSPRKDGTNVLAPAGLGQLKVIGQTEKYNPFKNFDSKKSQNFFIYDSMAKTYEPKQAKSIKQILDSGGIIGYVILVFGLFAILIAFKRYSILRFYDFSESTKQKVIKSLKLRQIKSNTDESDSLKWIAHPALGPIYSELKYPNIKNARSEAENIILNVDQKISSYSPVLLGVAAVAPLLGLLGTVTGMIATFDVISEIGTGNPKMLSGGISAALVTTEFGLIVAIPCLLLGNWLNSWCKRISRNLYDIFDATEVKTEPEV